jgi:hypothetical protein
MGRNSYDFSTKEYEILCKMYVFDEETRISSGSPKWRHHKYYKTLEGAKHAIREFRKHPTVTFTKCITRHRYMIIKRDIYE